VFGCNRFVLGLTDAAVTRVCGTSAYFLLKARGIPIRVRARIRAQLAYFWTCRFEGALDGVHGLGERVGVGLGRSGILENGDRHCRQFPLPGPPIPDLLACLWTLQIANTITAKPAILR
jgi:hypothetical protein